MIIDPKAENLQELISTNEFISLPSWHRPVMTRIAIKDTFLGSIAPFPDGAGFDAFPQT